MCRRQRYLVGEEICFSLRGELQDRWSDEVLNGKKGETGKEQNERSGSRRSTDASTTARGLDCVHVPVLENSEFSLSSFGRFLSPGVLSCCAFLVAPCSTFAALFVLVHRVCRPGRPRLLTRHSRATARRHPARARFSSPFHLCLAAAKGLRKPHLWTVFGTFSAV